MYKVWEKYIKKNIIQLQKLTFKVIKETILVRTYKRKNTIFWINFCLSVSVSPQTKRLKRNIQFLFLSISPRYKMTAIVIESVIWGLSHHLF